MYYKKQKCWMCGKVRELTEHHIIPKILRELVKGLEKHKVNMCEKCHAKVHILLPMFYSDGSYRWKGSERWNVILPEWKDWSKDEILEWDGDGNENGINKS